MTSSIARSADGLTEGESFAQWRAWADIILGAVLVPALFLVIIVVFWRDPRLFLAADQAAQEQGIMEEWFNEARIGQAKLGDLVGRLRKASLVDPDSDAAKLAREDILEFLGALGVPTSITINQQIPLFPNIFQLNVEFDEVSVPPVIWNSGLPRAVEPMAKSWLVELVGQPGVRIRVDGQLRTYGVRKSQEEERRIRARRALGISLVGLAGAFVWLGWSLRQRTRQRKERRKIREAQLEAAAEVSRARGEKLAAEAELLQHRVDQQEQVLKSIQVVAGAYAHNLQNLLLPPGRLVEDCIRHENLADKGDSNQAVRLQELKRLLSQASDRVRQTLQALRRDPGQYQPASVELDKVARQIHETWRDLASHRWQVDVKLFIENHHDRDRGFWRVWADESHLAQALENLVVNARDAIFEKRSRQLREAQNPTAREGEGRKEALLRASAWRGEIEIRLETLGEGQGVQLSVTDNGQGMSAETINQCLKPGFTTKHQNALIQGASSGMGLGLAFLATTVERTGGKMDIASEWGKGTRVSIHFPPEEIGKKT